jgi:general secretion pathway protein I
MRQHGFSLIEALVALFLIGMTGLALYSWMNTSIISMQRAMQQKEAAFAQANALEFVKTINPMLAPSGQEVLGRHTMVWESEEVVPVRVGKDQSGNEGYYRIGLYGLEITLQQDDVVLSAFSLRQVGFEQFRFMDPAEMPFE